jgi:hypothetical protein
MNKRRGDSVMWFYDIKETDGVDGYDTKIPESTTPYYVAVVLGISVMILFLLVVR